MTAFLFGSVLCATAQTMTWLIAARVVQGLGGGGCITLANVIVSDITTLRERPKFLAMSAFSYALGSNTGVSSLSSNSEVIAYHGTVGANRRSNWTVYIMALDILDKHSCMHDHNLWYNLFAPSSSRDIVTSL